MATGDQLLNTLQPYGAPLAKTSSIETIAAVFRDGKPIVSDIIYGKNAQSYLVAVAVPVVRDGKVVNCLTLNFAPHRLSRLLQSQQLPPSWVAAINDRQHQVVARSCDIEQRVGKPVVGWLASAEAAMDTGIITGPLMDGRPGQAAIQRLQEVPWHVVLAVPVAELPSSRPLLLFLLGGIVVGVGAVGVAIYAGRRITVPVSRLAQAGERLLSGNPGDLGSPSGIREVRELQHTLEAAGTAIQGYYQDQQRAAVAEETAKIMAASAQALRESREQLRLFIANAPAAIAMFDRDMRYLAVSHRWMSDYGMGDRNIIGQSHYEVFPDIPDAWKVVYQRGLAGEIVEAAEDCFARADGTVQWLRWEVRPWHSAEGVVGGIILFTENITKRMHLEKEMARLASFPMRNPQPIVEVELDGHVDFINPTAQQLFPDLQRRGPDHPWLVEWVSLADACRQGGQPVQREMTVGERHYYQVAHYVPEVQRIRIYGGDITERKHAEAALRAAHDALEQRVQERTAELSRAVQALEHQSDQLRHLASELTLAEHRERRRLARVLHDDHQQLLVAARLRVHSLERGADPQVQAICQQVVALLQEALEHSRSLTRELSPPILHAGGLAPALEWLGRWMEERHHLKVGVQVDPTVVPDTEDLTILLFQAVRELLFNVVKHAQVDAARVDLTQCEGYIYLRVADAGAGFDPATLWGEGGGVGGFGLFSIRQRLELVGGHLIIDSAPGQGSRFTLVLPLPHATAAVPPAPDQPDQTARAADSRGRRQAGTIRVLVVDDHSVVRHGLVHLLTAEPDLTVVGEAVDGESAVALARQLLPDVVTMDVNLPGMSGIEATRQILAAFPAIRVIGLSMFEEAEQAAAIRAAGAAAYLTKSGAADTLIAAIRDGFGAGA